MKKRTKSTTSTIKKARLEVRRVRCGVAVRAHLRSGVVTEKVGVDN